ncbi:hypothetical protein ACH473_03375 [Cellulosimicrobium funkei]|uniref:hypothetical protein n=1 Tax=Cellulosimicrobium funkei TaxID=264251 RepID=UPI003797B60E
MTLPLDDPDYALVWPVAIFRDEFRALVATSDSEALEILCREAFTSPGVADQILRDRSSAVDPFTNEPLGTENDPLKTARELEARLDELRERAEPRPYYNQRFRATASPGPRLEAGRRAFTRLIADLDRTNYLDLAFGKDCVDAPRDDPSLFLEERLDVADLWPLNPENWDEETFYSLIEVFHDAVARPRTIDSYHTWDNCGPHYGSFATKPGRALYLARVNAILERNGFSVRLAPDGEDAGRVVVATDDARDDLLERSITTADADSDNVRHAIRLFRSREATRTEKRSAVVSLASVLENERDLLKANLLSNDEGALFRIANQFEIRHRNADQRTDYDDAYLDWVFWWYLATVELVRSLRRREAVQP